MRYCSVARVQPRAATARLEQQVDPGAHPVLAAGQEVPQALMEPAAQVADPVLAAGVKAAPVVDAEAQVALQLVVDREEQQAALVVDREAQVALQLVAAQQPVVPVADREELVADPEVPAAQQPVVPVADREELVAALMADSEAQVAQQQASAVLEAQVALQLVVDREAQAAQQQASAAPRQHHRQPHRLCHR